MALVIAAPVLVILVEVDVTLASVALVAVEFRPPAPLPDAVEFDPEMDEFEDALELTPTVVLVQFAVKKT